MTVLISFIARFIVRARIAYRHSKTFNIAFPSVSRVHSKLCIKEFSNHTHFLEVKVVSFLFCVDLLLNTTEVTAVC